MHTRCAVRTREGAITIAGMDPTSELQRQLGSVIRLGAVAELDLDAARCRVNTGEILSDFVPWFVPRAGECIEWSAPSIGEQVLLLSPGGDTHGAIALRGVYSDAFPAPSNAATKHLIRFLDGAVIEYDHEAHALSATLPAGGAATITADGGITLNGPLTVNGESTFNGHAQVNDDLDVSGTATAESDVIGGGISLKNHKHGGVQAGGSLTGAPQ